MNHSKTSPLRRQLLNRATIGMGLGITLCWALPLAAQQSVGRGWPVSRKAEWVGAGVPFLQRRRGNGEGRRDTHGNRRRSPRDIFTSDDFYRRPRALARSALFPLQQHAGARFAVGRLLERAAIHRGRSHANGAWGHCDVDYAREDIVSPYPFATARAHYEALLAEARAKGGPTQYTRERLPPDWDGRYTSNVSVVFGPDARRQRARLPPEFHEPPQWIIGYHNQIPTILSLLTPEYQQRLVQQLYHQAHDHAPQWSAMFCRPEGFMRWWSGPGGPGSLDVTVTPTRVQLLGGSGNAIRNVHVGRSFDMTGAVPHLGAEVPQWLGETVGFWDGDALVTWTSNVQGWFTHSSWEYLEQAANHRDLHADAADQRGNLLGLEHEAIFYDEEGLVQPIRSTSASCRAVAISTTRRPSTSATAIRHSSRQRSRHAGGAGHRDPVQSRGPLRPTLGRRLGRVLRERNAAAERRRHIRLPLVIRPRSVA